MSGNYHQNKHHNSNNHHNRRDDTPAFNYESHVKELNERFARLVKQLPTNNKAGSTRHEYEVEFSYALHELKNCPQYLQGKRFDQATAIVQNLFNHLKKSNDEKAAA